MFLFCAGEIVMNRSENSGLMVARPKRAGSYTSLNIRRKATQIANTVKVNNCEIVRISKGNTSVVVYRIEGNQMEVLVPTQVPIDSLAFHLESLLRGRKKVKIEIVGYETHRGKSVHGYKHHKNIHPALKSKEGDDDGSGTGTRHGKKRRRKKK
jgi:hypothetical protein